jgi:Male sterility protein
VWNVFVGTNFGLLQRGAEPFGRRLGTTKRHLRPVPKIIDGATGFLGRFLALEWLERLAAVDGKLICLVRAETNEDARRRLDKTFGTGDPKLLRVRVPKVTTA